MKGFKIEGKNWEFDSLESAQSFIAFCAQNPERWADRFGLSKLAEVSIVECLLSDPTVTITVEDKAEVPAYRQAVEYDDRIEFEDVPAVTRYWVAYASDERGNYLASAKGASEAEARARLEKVLASLEGGE